MASSFLLLRLAIQKNSSCNGVVQNLLQNFVRELFYRTSIHEFAFYSRLMILKTRSSPFGSRNQRTTITGHSSRIKIVRLIFTWFFPSYYGREEQCSFIRGPTLFDQRGVRITPRVRRLRPSTSPRECPRQLSACRVRASCPSAF